MAYKREYWQDHVVEFPNRYQETNLGNGLVNEVPAPGEIIQQGTPQSASKFNNMEEGIVAATEMNDYLMIMLLQAQRGLEKVKGEYGEVTMKNNQAYPFNSSGSTVALATPRDTTDYFVTVEVVEETGGSAGEITVYNRLQNGFGIRDDGSAKSVKARFIVTGGAI